MMLGRLVQSKQHHRSIKLMPVVVNVQFPSGKFDSMKQDSLKRLFELPLLAHLFQNICASQKLPFHIQLQPLNRA